MRQLNELVNYLNQENNFFMQFDWWYFSKIDKPLYSVYIPYYNPKTNRIDKFKPDFIFWLKKDNNYTILFVASKAPTYTDANYKIDGYKKIFEEKNKPKVFPKNRTVRLFMWGPSNTGEEYEEYWVNNFDDFAGKIS